MLYYFITLRSCKSFYPCPTIRKSGALIRTAIRLNGSAYLRDLNDAQTEAVTRPVNDIVRVVAGPGAGKTRVLTSRIAHLLQSDSSSRILAVTFTKKAAGEMQERLKKLLGEEEETSDTIITSNNGIVEELSHHGIDSLNRVTLGTFHSVCAKILRWNGKQLSTLSSVEEAMVGSSNVTNLDGNFGILDQGDQLRIIREFAKRSDIDLKKEKGIKVISILNALGKFKTGEVKEDDIKKSRLLQIAQMLYPYYRQHLFSTNALDFDDLMYMTRELLETDRDVCNGLRKRWPHILVDEFQDTSQVQLDLVKKWTSDSLLIVGDADQSIYSWRGANVESMTDFRNAFQNVNTVYLMENYRSTTSIVKAAQKIITSCTSSSAADLRQDMKPMRAKGPLPRILACPSSKAEASYVVKTIQGMIAEGEVSSDQSVAILYRTNAQSRDLEEACVKNNLPYVVWGSMGTFYSRAEIKDCLCFLRWINNGYDQSAMLRAFKTPPKGIGGKAVIEFQAYCQIVNDFYLEQKLEERPSPLDLLIAMTEKSIPIHPDAPEAEQTISTRAMNRFKGFSQHMSLIKKKAYKESVSELIRSIIEILDLKDHFDSISKSSNEFEDRWNNVQELRKAAEKYTSDGIALEMVQNDQNIEERPLTNFLDDVALFTETSSDEETITKANLMTIHGSKGMEFDVVFLVGNEDGTFPTARAINEGEESTELDEEKRLCYVAMTRAKNILTMTWRKEVASFTGDTFMKFQSKRSRFLNILMSTNKDKKDDSSGKKDSTLRRNKSERRTASAESGNTQLKPTNRQLHSHTLFSNTGSDGRGRRKAIKSDFRESQKDILDQATRRKRSPSLDMRVYRRKDTAKGRRSSTQMTGERTPDLSWIYPVGSSILHKRHGPGVVLPFSPPNENGELMIRIKLEGGEEIELPATEPDLLPN